MVRTVITAVAVPIGLKLAVIGEGVRMPVEPAAPQPVEAIERPFQTPAPIVIAPQAPVPVVRVPKQDRH